MAQIEESGKGGRKKNLDLNIVPFIDLMSVLITFLLITAVWTQVSMIQIGSSIYGKKSPDQEKVTPPPDADVVLRIDIRDDGYFVQLGTNGTKLPNINGLHDEQGLLALLIKAKERYPNKTDSAIQMADQLPYEQLIKGMDAALKSGFGQISVLTGGPK